MSLRLKKPSNSFPHNGWPFKDPKTGFICNGYEGTPEMHAVKIIAHRRANPHIYPPSEAHWFNQIAVREEILVQKHATNPELFVGEPDKAITVKVRAAKTVDTPGSTCTCGALDWEPTYCKTCSGKKVNGFKCRKCGKTRGR